MKRERGEECETKKNNWLDTGFVPLLLVTVGERYFPTDISIMLMRILMALGLLSISVVGTCLVSNELPIRIIVEKDEEGVR